MKHESIKTNYIYNTVFNIATLIIPFITTPYVSRVLGVENIGIYSFSISIATYFIIICAFGSSAYGQRNVAYHRNSIEESSQVFWDVVAFRLIGAFVATVSYCFYLMISNADAIAPLFIILIFNVAFDISWFYQGLEKFRTLVIRNMLIKLLGVVCIFLFVKSKSDLWVYTIINCSSLALGNLTLWIPLRKYITRVKRVHPFHGLKEMFLLFLPAVAIQVYAVLDKSMIGWISCSNYANGCYEQAEKIARVALTLATSIGTVVLPRVANLFYQKDTEQIKAYMYLAYRLNWFVALPVMLGLAGVAPVFIPIFLGAGFDDAIGLLKIFSLLVLFVSLANTTGISYLIPTKQQNVYTFAVSIAAVINVIANLILIPRYSAYGAAIASVFAEGLGVSIQLGYCIKNGKMEAKKIFIPLWKYAISSVVMLIIISAMVKYMSITVGALIIEVLVGVCVYIVMLFVLRDELFIAEFKRIIGNVIGNEIRS